MTADELKVIAYDLSEALNENDITLLVTVQYQRLNKDIR
jgi:hypothetical protein